MELGLDLDLDHDLDPDLINISSESELRHRSSTRHDIEYFENKNSCKRTKKQTIYKLIFISLSEFMTIIGIILCVNFIINGLFSINPMYLQLIIGLSVSVLSTFYKYKIFIDPSYLSKYCDCEKANISGSTIMSGIITVLGHKKGSLILNIPNSLFGILYYSILLVIIFIEFKNYLLIEYLINMLIFISLPVSVCLYITMIFEVRSICILCMSIHAVNFLNFLSLIYYNV